MAKPKLTRKYLLDHVQNVSTGGVAPSSASSDAEWGAKVFDTIVQAAAEQLKEGAETDRVEVNLGFTLTAVDTTGSGEIHPLGGCVEVCVKPPFFSVCYHRGFKGNRPGEG